MWVRLRRDRDRADQHQVVDQRVDVDEHEVMYDRLGRVAPVVEIPAAGHHIMLDQPITLVAALRTLVSDWDHSLPGTPQRPGAGREA